MILESEGYFDKTKTIKKIANGMAALPVKPEFLALYCHCDNLDSSNVVNARDINCPIHGSVDHKTGSYKGFKFEFDETSFCRNGKIPVLPKNILRENILQLIHRQSVECVESLTNTLELELPKSWEMHGTMVMLPSNCFRNKLWNSCGAELWFTIAKSLKADKVSRRSVISSDDHRTPQVELLYGTDGWVEHKDNNIKYMYDVTKCMFSSGNITEKLRIAAWHCVGETIVDLYAGIGYFTLPYLVHAKASFVHACEWNPDAVIALKKNLEINNVAEKCIVYEGDNRQVCPRGVADRVNLGLIPSSEAGWPVACMALKPCTGGILHIHENVTSGGTRVLRNSQDIECENASRSQETGQNVDKRQYSDQNMDSKHCDDQYVGSLCNDQNVDGTHYSGQIMGGRHSGETLLRQTGSNKQVDCTDECNLFASSEKSMTVNNSTDHHDGDLFDTSDNSTSSDSVHCKSDILHKVESENDIIIDCKNVDSGTEDVKKPKFSKKTKNIHEWREWAEATSVKIRKMLIDIHKSNWTTEIMHVEHVKSYAPHIDHLVLDLRCKPVS